MGAAGVFCTAAAHSIGFFAYSTALGGFPGIARLVSLSGRKSLTRHTIENYGNALHLMFESSAYAVISDQAFGE